MTGVFQDLTIVDVSGSVATSYAAKLFADYGARVINLEPAMGFMTRGLKPLLPSGESAMHGFLHTNKLSVIARQELFSEEPRPASQILLSMTLSYCPVRIIWRRRR